MIKVGDYVRVNIVGMMEPGDPAYRVTEISEDNIYTIVQEIRSYKHTMKVTVDKLNKL
jgi:hypothetical protein